MRTKHVLWLIGNDRWLRTPDDNPVLRNEAQQLFAFTSLKEFAEWADKEHKAGKKRARK